MSADRTHAAPLTHSHVGRVIGHGNDLILKKNLDESCSFCQRGVLAKALTSIELVSTDTDPVQLG